MGKSNLFTRFALDEFNTKSNSTIGVEYTTREASIDDKLIQIQIWDTAGQEKYKSISVSYYKKAKGVLLVFDITNKISFENLKIWIKDLNENMLEDCKILAIANKIDLENERQVSKEEIEKFCKNHKFEFIETSALSSHNVDFAFNKLIKG